MKTDKFWTIFIKESFYALTGFIFLAAILEWFWPRIISAYFNFNYLLILWLVLGGVMVWLANGFSDKK
jgi:hypothetical protein